MVTIPEDGIPVIWRRHPHLPMIAYKAELWRSRGTEEWKVFVRISGEGLPHCLPLSEVELGMI